MFKQGQSEHGSACSSKFSDIVKAISVGRVRRGAAGDSSSFGPARINLESGERNAVDRSKPDRLLASADSHIDLVSSAAQGRHNARVPVKPAIA
jgi:hypothetical protein